MTPDERAVAALAEALDAVPNIVTSGWGYTPDEHLAECRKLAPAIWNAIDRDAIRAALLADVRREVEELPTHEFIDSYEHGTTWLAVDRGDVLRLLGDPRRP